MPHDHVISTLEALNALYQQPSEDAQRKERDHLDQASQRFIGASPFMLFASAGSAGMDCSPRGDQPGFVTIVDERTLMFPDRRGNNRIDSLRNVIENPQVGLLFLVPGVNECLRVNGHARINNDPVMLQQFAVDGVLPRSVLIVTVAQAFTQCSRAVLRAGLWHADPTRAAGVALDAHTDGLDKAVGCSVGR
jgi:PPOX class probable FMN-dependent enzyme